MTDDVYKKMHNVTTTRNLGRSKPRNARMHSRLTEIRVWPWMIRRDPIPVTPTAVLAHAGAVRSLAADAVDADVSLRPARRITTWPGGHRRVT